MRPEKVRHERWKTKEVIYQNDAWTLVEGEYDGKYSVAIRWNGSGEEAGFPTSHGRPVWFVLPDELADVVYEYGRLFSFREKRRID